MTPSEPTLVLVGPMGAGKTSVGRRVARTLGRPFADTDALIVAAHGPIAALFQREGEEHFRALERQSVADAVARGGVVSLGGGAVLDASTRALLAPHDVVFLTVEPCVVGSRIAGGHRPLLASGEDADDPVARWVRIFDARRALYEEVADLIVDTSNGPLSRVVETIAEWTAERRSPEARKRERT